MESKLHKPEKSRRVACRDCKRPMRTRGKKPYVCAKCRNKNRRLINAIVAGAVYGMFLYAMEQGTDLWNVPPQGGPGKRVFVHTRGKAKRPKRDFA